MAAASWTNNIQGVQRVLYRLSELIKETGIVFIPEGEKHVDAMRAWGLRATCNPMGTGGGWKPEYSEVLHGQDVVILPDNDPQSTDKRQANYGSIQTEDRCCRDKTMLKLLQAVCAALPVASGCCRCPV